MPWVSKNPRRRTLSVADLNMGAGKLLTQNRYTEFGRITMIAGQGLAWGYGNLRGQGESEGRVYMELHDAADAIIPGTLRVDLHDSNDRVVRTVFESDIGALETLPNNRMEQIPAAVQALDGIHEDEAYVFKINTTAAAATVTTANCVVQADCTRVDANLV